MTHAGRANFRFEYRFVFSWFIFVLSLNACSPSGTAGPSIQLTIQDVAVTSSSRYLQLKDFLPSFLRAETSGQNRSSDLTSLKYFIRQIAICESLSVTANAHSNPTHCLDLYTGSEVPAYNFTEGTDYASIASIARQDTTYFVDLMTESGKASLNRLFQLKRPDVGIYNWGFISYYPPVRFKGTLYVNNDPTTSAYYTHDGVTAHIGSGNHVTESTNNFTSGVPEEATVLLPLGATWFRLHTPMTIDHADIDGFVHYSLDLLFNSEGIVKAHSNAITLSGAYLLRDSPVVASSNKMSMAPLALSPISRYTGQTIARESYLLDFSAVAGVSDRFNLRFDLFYVNEDETKSITGVESKVLYRIVGQSGAPITTTEVSDFPRISTITRNADGTFNFLLPDSTTIIQNFTRLTTAGATGTASVQCSSNWAPSSCAGTLSVPVTLTSLGTL